MRPKFLPISFLAVLLILASSCQNKSSHEEMLSILEKVKSQKTMSRFSPVWKLEQVDSLLALPNIKPEQLNYHKFLKGNVLLEAGREEEAIALFQEAVGSDTSYKVAIGWTSLALAHLRTAERVNCITNHASASCIIPIRGLGIHQDRSGASEAIKIYQEVLKRRPNDLESRWLLNLACMTLGEYPFGVPKEWLIPGIGGDTTTMINPFEDIAGDLGLAVNNTGGGVIADDFDNDGYLDLITSAFTLNEEMHFFKNMKNGTFADVTARSGLKGINGGLNIQQTDYNNDGFRDIFVLRGAWNGEAGREPNSLLRNNGDGTFTDVTTTSGLLSFHPTQTATWNDFNNDGWLDVFIGNESQPVGVVKHPCELYINNQDGTFREVAAAVGVAFTYFVKGTTSGDYNNDGKADLFISTMNGNGILMKNTTVPGKEVSFEDVSVQSGLTRHSNSTFPTWFWDFDNDGWLDIFICDYTFDASLAHYAAAEKLNIPAGSTDKMLLYRNNHDGTFTNVAKELGLNKVAFAMGSNFGDIDNDGYLDMYLGTGNPLFQSILPNLMFRNDRGKRFEDVTASARVGHLQKGHGISFADLDNDGDQDIYIEMGGAYPGDTYQNSFFMNPGQGGNNWICLDLQGMKANRAAIGTRVKVTFTENGVKRSVYRDVNSGGSFGSSPLRREIGIGKATLIDEIEIRWHGSERVDVFKDIKPNQFLKIVEGENKLQPVDLKSFTWTLPDRICAPELAIRLSSVQ